jgi:hypothetical protein
MIKSSIRIIKSSIRTIHGVGTAAATGNAKGTVVQARRVARSRDILAVKAGAAGTYLHVGVAQHVALPLAVQRDLARGEAGPHGLRHLHPDLCRGLRHGHLRAVVPSESR